MGKIRTRIIGDESIEEKQKKKQKERAQEKKLKKGKGQIKAIEVDEISEKKLEKAKKIMSEQPSSVPQSGTTAGKGKKAVAKVTSRGKKYQEIKKKIDKTKKYTLKEAIEFLKKNRSAKFDESVEIHLNLDTAGLKGEVSLTTPIGKVTRIKILDDKVLSEIEKDKIEFDVLITHPSFMPKLARFAKILGPKGLMPNPKAGTISPKPEEVLAKLSKGGLRWKTEAKFPLIHQMLGKLSFEDKAIEKNIRDFINSVGKNHILGAFIKSTMSPSLKLDIEKV